MRQNPATPRSRVGYSFAGMLLTAGVWSYLIAFVAWRILRYVVGDTWLPVRVASYFTPWLLFLLVLGTVVALLLGRRRLVALTLVSAAIVSRTYWPTFVPSLPRVAAAPETWSELRVMTFNVHYANRDASSVAALVRAEAPDIIAFQEITAEMIQPLQGEIGADYPFFLVDDARWPRLAIVSRLPLTGLAPPTDVWRVQWAIAETTEGPVVVWNLHSPPSVKQSDWEWQRRIFGEVATALAPEECPTVVLGDLNTTDQNENYSLLSDSLIDAHRQVGKGLGLTFPDMRFYAPVRPFLGPLIRIDHILFSPHFRATEVHVGAGGHGSDHFPVIVTLAR